MTGLTTSEVEERRARGEGETGARSVTKSTGAILRENICTLFNALNFAIAILLFAVGAYSNMLFIAIIILNIVIGIVQEFKAKKLVDELTILNQPHAVVLRDGKETTIEAGDIVKDDVMVLDSGKQICNDAVVIDGRLEVNESLLTGESDSIDKTAGSELYSGSSVISGRAYARVTHVGDENYTNSLINEVRQEKRVHSELLDSMRKVTRFTSFLIIPLGVLLFVEAMFLRHSGTYDAVVSSAAALLGMLPKGLVLLISVSLAPGVLHRRCRAARGARRRRPFRRAGHHPVLVEAQMGRHHDARSGWCGRRASPRAGGRVGGGDRNRVPGRPGAHPWREPAR